MILTVHAVDDVFTPASVAELSFVERHAVKEALVDALKTRGKQVVVYGHSGCGKSTLLENTLRQLYPSHIRTLCMKGMTFAEILEDAVSQLRPSIESEVKTKSTKKISAGGKAGLPGGAEISVGGEQSSELETKSIVLSSTAVTPHFVAHEVGKKGACWVLEDFHKIDAVEKNKLSQAMKMFMDMTLTYPSLKMIFIGAVNSGREVIQYDPELRNRVAEIHVPLMSQIEIRQIISLGEGHLNVIFDQRIVDRIVSISNGLAAVCHQLALNYCRARGIEVTQNQKLHLDTTGWLKALEKYLGESSDTLKAAFDRSVKNVRKRKYDNGRLILKAMTQFEQDGATHSELLFEIRRSEPKYPAGNLATYLRGLQTEDRGAIVTYDDTSGKYAFSEPIHRAFCHSIFEQENQTKKRGIANLNELERMLATLVPELAKGLAELEMKKNGSSKKNNAS